jgi:radical SAM superfamily enzyme YgiQ (UPF0313 family)
MKILMVYPQFPDTFWSFKHALAFIGKKITNPPLGLLTVAALLPEDWEKKLIDLNISDLKDEYIQWADYIFISAMDIQRSSVQSLINRISQFNKKIIAGGPLFTESSEKFPLVDHFILNEGEITIPQFLNDLKNGIPKKTYRTDEYADMTLSPAPHLNLLKLSDYECMSIQFSRGCPYQCDFCNVTALLGHRPRTKSVNQVITELENLYNAGWRRNIFFVDDNFIGNKKYIKDEVLPALIEWRKGKTGCAFITEASVNLAEDPVLLDLMRRAGFVSVFVGIETPNKTSLIECNKYQNTKIDLIQSVRTIHSYGIQVMSGFIVGFDNDQPEIFEEMISFIQDSGIVTAMVGLLQAPTGTKLYDRLLKENRLLSEMSGDNADGETNIVPRMNRELLKNGYYKIIDSIYSPKFLYPRIKHFLDDFVPLRSISKIQSNEIMAFIKTIFKMGMKPGEAGLYWNLFFTTLFKYPYKMTQAITLTIYGYHFRKVNAMNRVRLTQTKSVVNSEIKGYPVYKSYAKLK